ncbi:ImmA/IrrE family metallo-endopeptidase [Staphylococcus saprophyticus]|uniref:ImmA/IrrE family metallo-endopeptidase n=1 Tax=Staphylococcus TaxID=1279 RepID=UPI0022EB4B7A|nr:ImmA/IrrE family metallo-endopeptidase [Staphylococcus saprophyticus]
MWKYEKLMSEYDFLEFEELSNFPSSQDGYICGNKIYIKDSLTPQQKHEILAEEIAHYKITYGNILDQTNFNNRKFEGYARRQAYKMLMPINEIKELHRNNITTLHDIATHFEVTEQFVKSALSYYVKKDIIPGAILSM